MSMITEGAISDGRSVMKVALTCPDAFSVWRFRRWLIEDLIERDISVHVISTHDAYVDRLKELGVIFHPVEFSRFINPKQDILYLVSLWKLFRSERFDIVHNESVKPNVYGAIAAKLTGIPRVIAMVEGLGFTFSSVPGFKNTLIRWIVKNLYRIGFGFSDKIWFVNKDNMNNLISLGIATPEKSVLIRSGGGLDLSEFSLSAADSQRIEHLKMELKTNRNTLFVSMVVARLIWSKGVREFVIAAQTLLTKFPHVKFLLIGPMDEDSPEAVPKSFVTGSLPENVQWLGFRDDIREILALTDIVVLPSYYGEGLPYVLLEGMAMSKPIVTTDNVGCREVVDEGRNGFLVPVKDSHALATAIGVLLRDKKKREQFGDYSRRKMEAEFDQRSINPQVLKLFYGLDENT